MTSEKLYGILKFLDTLDSELDLQTSLESIRDALTNLVSSPAQPQYQSTLADALRSFETAAIKMSRSISPSQLATIKEMGGEQFFDPAIADKVKTSVQTNAMTPTVARDFVRALASERSKFLSTVRSARQGLEDLGVKESKLEPGSADLAFLIPRDIFENQLGALAKELGFISRLIQDFSEAVTGTPEPVELEQLSSSVPTVSLLASAGVIAAIATVVNKFLEAWEKIERIRKVRTELTEIGMKGRAVEELTEQITTTVDEVVEESTDIVIANYKKDAGRKSELNNAIRQDVRRLFGQIERGLTIEFRAEPKDDEGADDQKVLADISNLGLAMQFPQIAKEPILLESGEVLEGELQAVKHSKKTTVHKSTVSKKESQRDGKQDN
jgi:hypothetical protein